MDYVMLLLEREKKNLEKHMHTEDLMHRNRQQANLQLKYIHEIKRALKVLKAKTRT